MTGAPTTVLLCDDVDDIRHLMRLALSTESDFEVVGEASDGKEAITQAGELMPDVIVLDINMPAMNGLDALPKIRNASPGSKVLVLSGFETHAVGPQALEQGAHGYMEKGASISEIAEQLRNLARGR